MTTRDYRSWGHYPHVRHRRVLALRWRDEPFPEGLCDEGPVLPFGNGRSYGDSCLNDGGMLLDVRGLDRFMAFDPKNGVLRCEAGVLLGEILEVVVPQGWFLNASPGTRFVTVGGAIANDVHGKGHHREGSFGRHVRRLELLRSDGSRRLCSPQENSELFGATIGGLGLTGVILWAEIQLRPIPGPWLATQTIRFYELQEFFELAERSDQEYDYTVAWVDCVAGGRNLGRGVFSRGRFVADGDGGGLRGVSLGVPVQPPVNLISRPVVKAFNKLYYWRHRHDVMERTRYYRSFFYPLDGIRHWNRLYGPKGFLPYQCVVPFDAGRNALREVLEHIVTSGQGSPLVVLKRFGDLGSPGWLSFPRPGYTLALDFPNQGQRTLDLLAALDVIVDTAGGALYPAKDARMSGEVFRRGFPRWEAFRTQVDPCFSSSFWRRVIGKEPAALPDHSREPRP